MAATIRSGTCASPKYVTLADRLSKLTSTRSTPVKDLTVFLMVPAHTKHATPSTGISTVLRDGSASDTAAGAASAASTRSEMPERTTRAAKNASGPQTSNLDR